MDPWKIQIRDEVAAQLVALAQKLGTNAATLVQRYMPSLIGFRFIQGEPQIAYVKNEGERFIEPVVRRLGDAIGKVLNVPPAVIALEEYAGVAADTVGGIAGTVGDIVSAPHDSVEAARQLPPALKVGAVILAMYLLGAKK